VTFTGALPEPEGIATSIISALRKVMLYEMQQRAWDAMIQRIISIQISI